MGKNNNSGSYEPLIAPVAKGLDIPPIPSCSMLLSVPYYLYSLFVQWLQALLGAPLICRAHGIKFHE